MINWKLLAPIIIGICAVVAPIALTLYKTPDLTYQILESYQYSAEESVTCILMRNIGHETAHEVLVRIKSSHPLDELIIESPESYEIINGWENQTEAKISFQRIVEGVDITIYASVKTLSPEIEVSITSEEGAGRQYEEKEKSRLLPIVLMLIGSILLTFGTLLLAAEKYPKFFAKLFGIKKKHTRY